MSIKQALWALAGCLSLGAGAAAAVLPLLPSFPFLLLAGLCFARSSRRLHAWFLNTGLYNNHVLPYLKGQGLTRRAKIRLMVSVTLLMTIGFVMMGQLLLGRIVLGLIWAVHLLYFSFGVKTLPQDPG